MKIVKILLCASFIGSLALPVQASSKTPAQEQLLNDAVDIGYLIRATDPCTTGKVGRQALITSLSSILRKQSDLTGLSVNEVSANIKAGAQMAASEFNATPPDPMRCIEFQTELQLMAKSKLHFYSIR